MSLPPTSGTCSPRAVFPRHAPTDAANVHPHAGDPDAARSGSHGPPPPGLVITVLGAGHGGKPSRGHPGGRRATAGLCPRALEPCRPTGHRFADAGWSNAVETRCTVGTTATVAWWQGPAPGRPCGRQQDVGNQQQRPRMCSHAEGWPPSCLLPGSPHRGLPQLHV